MTVTKDSRMGLARWIEPVAKRINPQRIRQEETDNEETANR
jgi:hypothetical protein